MIDEPDPSRVKLAASPVAILMMAIASFPSQEFQRRKDEAASELHSRRANAECRLSGRALLLSNHFWRQVQMRQTVAFAPFEKRSIGAQSDPIMAFVFVAGHIMNAPFGAYLSILRECGVARQIKWPLATDQMAAPL